MERKVAGAQKHRVFWTFLRRKPGTVGVSIENSKDGVNLGGVAIYSPAPALFRMIARPTCHTDFCGAIRVISMVIGLGLSACGRYQAPLTPEELAPAAVASLAVTTTDKSVVFTWVANDTDRRGKELKSAEGYSVERKELVHRGDETDPDVEFEQLGFLKDTHVEVREKLREEARAAGKIGRTVKVPEDMMKFTFTDATPVNGKTYVYQIVPQNQGGVEGQVGQIVKVVFQGEKSPVVMSVSDEILNQQAALAPPQ